MPIGRINLIFDVIKKEFLELAEEGKQTFLFVYATGHGVIDR